MKGKLSEMKFSKVVFVLSIFYFTTNFLMIGTTNHYAPLELWKLVL